MDRRTFLFVVAFFITIVGTNIYFQNRNEQKKHEWIAQQNKVKLNREAKLQEEILERTAKETDIPLVKLYKDKQLSQPLTFGILVKTSILTLSRGNDLPTQAYASNGTEYRLVYSNDEVAGTPVIYRDIKSQEPLEIAPTPTFGHYDVQLVSFNPSDNNHPVGITLGEFTDGHFSLPLHDTFAKSALTIPRYLAIALLKTDQGYLPVGLLDAERQTVVPIQDSDSIYSVLKVIGSNHATIAKPNKVEEKIYVLENEYQQLVFSNIGAALAEINLPFKTDKNTKSVVREIEFDRKMVEDHPQNAYFPSRPYYTPSESGDVPLFHKTGKLGGYYPLLRRNLMEQAPRTNVIVKPQYYALNLVSEYPEFAELAYEVTKFEPHAITFEAKQSNRRITKTFSFGEEDKDGPYCINLAVKIEGENRELWLTSGVPEVEWISGGPAPILKYRITRNNESEVVKIDLPSDAVTVTSIYPDWICNSNGFLGTIQDPLKESNPGYRVQYVSGSTVPSRLVEIDEEYDVYKPADLPGYMTLVPLKTTGGTVNFRFFAGPFDGNILNKIDVLYADPETGSNPDYQACQTMHGWFTFISEPFAKFLLILMNFFHTISGSWALSIFLLTVCLRLILYPLNQWSTKSMVKMQQIGPEVAAIQEKHKKDPRKAQLEIMTLYRERGINPASGCLPLLIQMPFLIGMFDLLKSSFALRGAPFIPGWIDDLTAPDVLFSWDRPLFFIGNEFHLLPILLGGVMFLQQRFMSTAPSDPAQMTDQQRQQKAMGTIMTVVFSLMFYHFPSGLNIYWLSSMLLGMLQQWYTTKTMPAAKPVVLPPKAPLKRSKLR